jgi:threonine dehydrogenase-like Zn-dependent dehydrogenase
MAGDSDMRAVRRGERGVELARVRAPEARPGEVTVAVAYAGICRTDLAVADGEIEVTIGRILGHELSGRVDGEPVTVIPFSSSGAWLGVQRDGAFADRVCVPAECVLRLPTGMSLLAGAYVEPVAAALGVLASIERGMRVLVSGDGRIAELTARVIEAHGADVLRTAPVAPGDVAPGDVALCDVAIEHDGVVEPLLAALRPGGTLLLKSRRKRQLALPAGDLVARELTVRGVSHGSFAAAIDWLCTRRIEIDDLLAPPRPLEEFATVFAAARASETRKQMFAIGDP